MSSNITASEIQSALNIVTAIGSTIQELGSVPSGHLYARVMGHLSLQQYEAVIRTLERAGLVTRSHGHLLKWSGPQLEPRQGATGQGSPNP